MNFYGPLKEYSSALITPVETKQDCFKKPFEAIRVTLRISSILLSSLGN